MDEVMGAKAGANATLTAVTGRAKAMHAPVSHIAKVRANVFHVWHEGRLVFNPETGKDEPCLRDQVGPHGVIGHWYDRGVVSTSENPLTDKQIRQLRRRMFNEKILTKIKGFLDGLKF